MGTIRPFLDVIWVGGEAQAFYLLRPQEYNCGVMFQGHEKAPEERQHLVGTIRGIRRWLLVPKTISKLPMTIFPELLLPYWQVKLILNILQDIYMYSTTIIPRLWIYIRSCRIYITNSRNQASTTNPRV